MRFLIGDPAISDEDAVCATLRRLEAKYGFAFPPVLWEFYRRHDGQKIALCKLEVNGYSCVVSELVSLCAGQMTFEWIVDNDREDGFINPGFFPLAMDKWDNTYYWQEGTEQVYLLLADDIENPFLVADSIQEFFDLLERAAP